MTTVDPAVHGSIETVNLSGAGAAVLVVLVIASMAAAYYTGRLYDRTGMIIAVAGVAAAFMALFVMGGLRFN